MGIRQDEKVEKPQVSENTWDALLEQGMQRLCPIVKTHRLVMLAAG